MHTMTETLSAISAVTGTALMALLLVGLLTRFFAETLLPDSNATKALTVPRPKEGGTGSWKRAFACAVVWFAISRMFILLVTLVIAHATGRAESYCGNMYGYWAKWDAPHYIGLIKNWYVNEGDARFHIVFFPMYPLVCRVLLPIFGGNADVSAMVVANCSAVAAGALMYQLTALERSERTAVRAVRLFFLNPLSFFLSIPYTESMFLLLTIASVYLARRRKYGAALIIGAMCAACRLMGIAVAIPVFHAMLCDDRDSGRICAKQFAKRFAQCLAILAGLAAYLLLNWKVTGNPLQFWIYQRDHWYNTTGTLWNTFAYTMRYALEYDAPMRLATWAPTVVLIYGTIGVLIAQMRRANAGDAAYGWAYMYMTIVPTWLISGPRYVSGLYCLYPMLADRAEKKWQSVLLMAVFAAGLGYMACMFAFTSGVY